MGSRDRRDVASRTMLPVKIPFHRIYPNVEAFRQIAHVLEQRSLGPTCLMELRRDDPYRESSHREANAALSACWESSDFRPAAMGSANTTPDRSQK